MAGRILGDFKEGAGSPASALSQAVTGSIGYRQGYRRPIELIDQPHRAQGTGAHSWLFPSTALQPLKAWANSLIHCSPGCGFASSGIDKLTFKGYGEELCVMAQACDLSSSEAGGWQVSGSLAKETLSHNKVAS